MLRWTLSEWCRRFLHDGSTEDSASSTDTSARTASTTTSCGMELSFVATDASIRTDKQPTNYAKTLQYRNEDKAVEAWNRRANDDFN